MKNIDKLNEFQLAAHFKNALKKEDYLCCDKIKKEIDRRISIGTINSNMMKGFKFYNPKEGAFVGKANYEGLNGLFDNVI